MNNRQTQILHDIVTLPFGRLFPANGPTLARLNFVNTHPWPRLNIKLEGYTRIVISEAGREQEHEMRYGDICFLSACAPIRVKEDSGSALALVLRHNYLRMVYSETDGGQAVVREYYHIHDTLSLATIYAFKAMASLCDAEQTVQSELARRLVQSILELAEQDVLRSRDESGSRSRQLWLQIVNHVDEHCLTELPRERLADEFRVTPDYISRLFQRYANCTYKEYLNHQRMEHAARLLHSGRASVDETAWQCGFRHTAYFIRIFRLYHGVTPGCYRDTLIRS